MLKVLTHLRNESTVFDLHAGGLLSGSDDHEKNSILKWYTELSCLIQWRLNISDYSALLHLSWEFSIFFSLRYTFLVGKHAFSLDAFRVSSVGRKLTHFMLSAMEMLHIVPQGSTDVHNVLLTAADALIQGGRKDIFTPMFRLVLRKPL